MEGRDVRDEVSPTRPAGLRPPFWAGATAIGVVALVVVAVLWGPRSPSAERDCPAIGYSSLLEVTLTGDTAGVSDLQARDGDDDVWQPPLPTGPDVSHPAIPTSRDGDTLAFTLFYPTNPVELRALDEAGNVLAQTEKNVDWVRVGGSEACGGPMEGSVGWVL